jgi:hypothetical protein
VAGWQLLRNGLAGTRKFVEESYRAIILAMRIPSLQDYRGRDPNGTFEALPPDVRRRAQQWLHKFCKRWGADLPYWRFAILAGQAKRLALNPPDSAWGRKMLAKRGGLAVQIDYRLAGRNPTAEANAARRLRAAAKLHREANAEAQRRVGGFSNAAGWVSL